MDMDYLGNLGSMDGGLAIFASQLYLAVETAMVVPNAMTGLAGPN